MKKSQLGVPALASESGQAPSLVDRHTNNFDFIRFVLATAVIVSHSPDLIDGGISREPLARITPDGITLGVVSVNSFFLISGFLILQSWLFTGNAIQYLQKRMLRIYPGFIAAVLFSVLIAGAIGAANARVYWGQMDGGYLFQNLKRIASLRLPTTPATFQGLKYPVVNGAIWTVRYEFICYLLVGAMGLVGIYKRRITVLFLAAAACLAHVLQANGVLRLGDRDIPIVGVIANWPRFGTYFLVGMCFYLYRDEIRIERRLALGSALLVFLGCAFRGFSSFVLPTFGAYILFYFAFVETGRLRRFGRSGDFSYGLFCYGWPSQSLILWTLNITNPWVLFLWSFATAFALAFCSWHLVEKPMLRLKKRKSAPEAAGAPPPSVAW